MSSDNNVVITPEVHKPRLELMKAPVGCTVTEILRCAIREGKFDASDLPYVEIRINGKLLPRREDALDRCLLDNEIVQISMAVRGDNPLKNAFQLIVQVTAIVVGFYFGPWAAAAVQIASGLATAALFRNKQDRLADPNSSSALNEQSNQIRRRAPMPLVLGKQRIGFDVAALSYTQNIGNDSWLNVIFGVHYGPCVVDDIKIGETLLRDYPASDYQIEYFLNPGPRNSNLYPGNVFQENFNNKLEFAGIPGGTWEVITPLPGAKGADVDFTLPAGLSYSTDKGKIRNEEVAGQIQIAEVGTENWQPAPFPGHDSARDKDNQLLPPGSWYLNMKTANAIRMTKSFALDPSKNWKIRVRAYDRDNDPADHPGHTWDTYLTALRSKFDGKPIIDENLACVVLRIKASGDLGNTLPVVSGVVTPIVPVFKNGNWDTREPSSNQAALLRWCLTDLPAARPLLQDQINATCGTVYDLIKARQWEAALHITEEVSQEDLMRLCGLAGRFATYWSGEDLCFVGDWEKPIARQIFSASNIQSYKYRREFQDEIHAVLVEFKNVDQDSRADELWVYADGYDASNAELFETYTLQYACKQTRAYKEGRVYLARRELKSETHEWTCAFDSVTSTFGDRVRLSHYSALYGQDSGRVVNRIFNGDKTLVIGIRVDFEAEQISGTSYSVDVRRSDIALVGLLLEPVTGDVSSKNLYFAVPIPVANAPRKDDLVVFGETNLVTEDVEIDSFEPQSRNEVRISASPYVATQIEAAETGPIPSLPTNLLPKPQVPRVRILQRYGNPEGVEVVFDIEIKDANTIRGFVARWRYSGPDSPWNTIGILPPEARNVRTPPIQRPAYDPDDPIDAITYVDVQIVTLSIRGDYSQPATANNIEVRKEVQKLTGFDAIGVGRPAPDGSSKAAIAVIADPVTAGDIQYLDVEAAVLAQDAEYVSLGSLPASNPIGDFTEIDGGQDYVVRGRWRTQDNWYSDWEYVGLEGDPVHVPGGRNVANDTVNIGGRPVADVIAELTSIDQLLNNTAQAVQDLQDLYGDTASAAASAAAAAASEAAAIQAKADALIAKGEAQASATTAATKATEAAGSASAALTSKNDAAASATTATTKAQDATNAAASATTQAGLAAGSATAAGGSATAAAGSASTAATKATEAGNSATAANASKVAAESARDTADQKATAAASSAASAATSSTQAGQSASAAQTAKTDAETARAQAQTFRNEAADSADDANGAAATATQQAGLATTARNDAAGSASAALTSRNQASGFATAAETASAAAASSQVSASIARDLASESATNAAYLDAGAVYTFQNNTDAWSAVGATLTASPSGVLLVGTTADPQIARGVQIQGSRYTRIIVSLTRTKARTSGAWDGTVYYTTSGHGYSASFRKVIARDPSVGERTELTWDMASLTAGGDDWLKSTITSLRLDLDNGPDGEFTIHNIRVVGSDTAAPAKSASAAAISASNASASETASGLSAAASQTARTGAETARGQAETYRNETATSRDTAQGAAAAATAQAVLAAGSRDAAAGSADAAAGSASTATTKAGEAGASAAAAAASQVSASTARDRAAESASNASYLDVGAAFTFANTVDGWGAVNGSLSPSPSGALFIQSGADPQLIRSGLAILGARYTRVIVTLTRTKARTSGGWDGTLYFSTDFHGISPSFRQIATRDPALGERTELTWDMPALTNGGADWLTSTIRSIRLDLDVGPGGEFTIHNVRVVGSDTAAPAKSASAAALSASLASASETAAGQSATASAGAATTASTKAGEASTFASQASTSASNAAGSAQSASLSAGTAATARDQANSARDTAQGAAATAIEQASAASASAAEASISANLAASAGSKPNRLLNSDFSNGLANWQQVGSWGSYIHGQFGPLAHSQSGGDVYLLSDPARVEASTVYTCSVVGDQGPTPGAAAMYFQFLRADQSVISDGNAFVGLTGISWTNRIASTFTTTPETVFVRVVFQRAAAFSYPLHVSRVMLAWGSEVAAWNNAAMETSIAAQLSVTAAVAADAQSRLSSARFEVIAAAGNDPAQLLIRADTSGSLARMVASSIGFANVVGGQVVEAMKLIGGEVFFMRPIYIDVGSSRLIVGPGNGWVLWFGGNDKSAAAATRTNGIFCLGTDGKVYHGSAELGSGVTAKAAQLTFSGSIGRSAPLTTLGTTEVMNVPSTGKFVLDVSAFAESARNGSVTTAQGTLFVFIVKDGVESLLAEAPASTDAPSPGVAVNTRALNMTVQHAHAGAVAFRVKAQGGGSTTWSIGLIDGVLKSTYFPT